MHQVLHEIGQKESRLFLIAILSLPATVSEYYLNFHFVICWILPYFSVLWFWEERNTHFARTAPSRDTLEPWRALPRHTYWEIGIGGRFCFVFNSNVCAHSSCLCLTSPGILSNVLQDSVCVWLSFSFFPASLAHTRCHFPKPVNRWHTQTLDLSSTSLPSTQIVQLSL